MKKLLLILLIGVIFTACKKEEPIKPFILDGNALVYVKGVTAPSNSKSGALTPLEVVKQATHIQGYNDLIAESDWVNGWHGKDTVSSEPALLRLADDIIYDHTGYNDYIIETSFIYSYDMVILRGTIPNYDTIAYIPNSLVEAAREAILLAFENEDTETVYTVFKDMFKFIPITGAEWKELKKQGLQ